MSLSGTLDTMPLSDLLQWLHTNRHSGLLTLGIDVRELQLWIRDGELVAMQGDGGLQHDIGQELLASGSVDDDQLCDAIQKTRDGRSLIEVLEQESGITEQHVRAAHSKSTIDRVLDLFACEHGSFHFVLDGSTVQILAPAEMDPGSMLDQAIELRSLLFEGMRRLDEWSRIRRVFPSELTVVRALDGNSGNAAWKILREHGQAMACVELCLRLGGSEFEAFQSLYRAYQLGLVEVEAGDKLAARGGAQLASVLIDNAGVLLDERQYGEATELLLMANNMRPDDDRVRGLLAEARCRHLEEMYQQMPPHLAPVAAEPIDAALRQTLSPRESYLLSRLKGRWDVATLVVAMPFSELQTLRMLAKLIHAGMARLSTE